MAACQRHQVALCSRFQRRGFTCSVARGARRVTHLAIVLGIVALCGCFGGSDAPKRRTLIDSRDNYDPRSLDPALSTDVPTGRAVGYVFDGLTRFTPTAEVEPGLAQRWEISSDGRTYTFHLRQSVRFHDNTRFSARDVVHSWERALDPATKSSASEFLYPIAGARDFHNGKSKAVSGLLVRDDSTLVITLEQPLAAFLKLLAMPVASIVPQRIGADFGEHPIGTGPW